VTATRGGIGSSGWIRIALVAAIFAPAPRAVAQALTQRGFVEGAARLFPQQATNDPVRTVGDVLVREEAIFKPAAWIQFAGGVDLRANSHSQIDDRWAVDLSDRGATRPRIAIRRLSATLTRGPITVDVGKQFIRWGKTDIVTPTDRFAPRDFLNVVDGDFLAVTGIRGAAQTKNETFEVVWLPRFTPSRIPLLDQRWTAVPPEAAALPLVDAPALFPQGSESGLRWSHAGAGYELSASFFDGFNHLPTVDVFPSIACSEVTALVVRRSYPSIRTYGADAAVPTKWFTIKGEAAYFTSPSTVADQYVLYVVQLERQTGEWLIVGGYAGEVVTTRGSAPMFAPDRGMTRSLIARASYTIDTTKSVSFETAVRQNGKGMYSRLELSQARSAHWRATIAAVILAGHADDFLGQYHRNSHATASLRYSF
jgi:hypothetical protein